jgi:hypothetical protein
MALRATKRWNQLLKMIVSHNTTFIKEMGIAVTNQELMKLGEIEMSKVQGIIKQEKGEKSV